MSFISENLQEMGIVHSTDRYTQGRRRRSGWSGLSRTNNLELNQLADQLELATLLSCNLWTITSTCSYVHFTDVIENA